MKPRALALELTKGCNLRCSYCYYADREDAYQPKQRMSDEVARRSVDLLMQDGPADQPVRLHLGHKGLSRKMKCAQLQSWIRFYRTRLQGRNLSICRFSSWWRNPVP